MRGRPHAIRGSTSGSFTDRVVSSFVIFLLLMIVMFAVACWKTGVPLPSDTHRAAVPAYENLLAIALQLSTRYNRLFFKTDRFNMNEDQLDELEQRQKYRSVEEHSQIEEEYAIELVVLQEISKGRDVNKLGWDGHSPVEQAIEKGFSQTTNLSFFSGRAFIHLYVACTAALCRAVSGPSSRFTPCDSRIGIILSPHFVSAACTNSGLGRDLLLKYGADPNVQDMNGEKPEI
ncbi:hypothetical protein PROFUN_11822 [Planoprotostelium fungivorum]|uniref:Uncharacterized protein n=1 Tax=Planoprotostelium fungivorum TaxID=1890364 RepID=A0A2P6N990_9EUKA|nr:hypothetical protein PROFUN_11822 [Planoprotostelium fungivorum]